MNAAEKVARQGCGPGRLTSVLFRKRNDRAFAMESSPKYQVVQWMVDTRPLWPNIVAEAPKERMKEFKTAASRALSLLPVEEQQRILRYYYVKDAKMNLLSCLLKRFAIAKLCNIPWSMITLSKSTNGKPCYIPKTSKGAALEFNVSHQAGIVIIIASLNNLGDTALGTDIVCVNERNDYTRIEREGFFSWVDMHSDVFAPSETQALKMDTLQLALPLEDAQMAGYARDAIARCQYPSQSVRWKNATGETGEIDGSTVVKAKLRRFYALWCLREAYVKMTGEALLAEWLQELEFRRFRTPQSAGVESEAGTVTSEAVEIVTDIEIHFKAREVKDVTMELRAFGRDYMIASAARVKSGETARVVFNEFVELGLEEDIYKMAEIN